MTASRGPRRTYDGSDRGVVPAVGKALEASIVVLYLSLLTASLFGGLVPDYRAAAGDELAERTLAAGAHQIQDAVGPRAETSTTRLRVDLPKTIRGRGYRIRAENGSLILDHPDAGIAARTRLALPDQVVRVEGTWHSRRRTTIRVQSVSGGVVVRLASSPASDGRRKGGGETA